LAGIGAAISAAVLVEAVASDNMPAAMAAEMTLPADFIYAPFFTPDSDAGMPLLAHIDRH
jgi:hypothetical protein